VVGRCKLNPIDPQLESARFQPLSLSSEKLVSKFAFKFNLRHYNVHARPRHARVRLSGAPDANFFFFLIYIQIFCTPGNTERLKNNLLRTSSQTFRRRALSPLLDVEG
jgi:hypothetical protein